MWNSQENSDTYINNAKKILIPLIFLEFQPNLNSVCHFLNVVLNRLLALLLLMHCTEFYVTMCKIISYWKYMHITGNSDSINFLRIWTLLNLEIWPYIEFSNKQIVCANPFKALLRILWNFVGKKNTMCRWTYYMDIPFKI